MAKPRIELPPALERARLLTLVHYADFQDLRAGRTSEVAARVARRARRLRALLGIVIVCYAALEIALFHRSDPLDTSIYEILGMTAAFVGLSRLIIGLDALAREDATDAEAEAAPDPPR